MSQRSRTKHSLDHAGRAGTDRNVICQTLPFDIVLTFYVRPSKGDLSFYNVQNHHSMLYKASAISSCAPLASVESDAWFIRIERI